MEVADGLVKLFFAWNTLGQVELTSDFGASFKQGDVVPPPRKLGSSTQSGGSSPYHCNGFRRSSSIVLGPLSFMSRPWID